MVRILVSVSTVVAVLFFNLSCSSKAKRIQAAANVSYHEALDYVREHSLDAKGSALMVTACDAGSKSACLVVGQLAEANQPHSLSILQGFTNSSSTQISVVANDNLDLEFTFWDVEAGKIVQPTIDLQKVGRAGSSIVAYVVTLQALQLTHHYRLDVSTTQGELLDTRQFTALNTAGKSTRVAVASCMYELYEPEKGVRIWNTLSAQNPQVVFLIGDNVYADVNIPEGASPDHLWQRYGEMRAGLQYYKLPKLIPTLAIWDDHDYGKHDSDRTYAYRDESLKMFNLFFPSEPDGAVLRRGPGVAKVFRAFGQKFILLDDRSFRSPPKTASNQETLFGFDQEKWILGELTADNAPSWLINGIQFFGAYHIFESYEKSQPESFKTFNRQLKNARRLFWLVTGDRHLAELMEISSQDYGFKTWELTTSGIQVKTYSGRWNEKPNPRQVAGVGEQMNFALVQSDVDDGGLKIKVNVLGMDGQTLFKRDLRLRR